MNAAIRKAAILVGALDPASAEAMLAQLDPQMARRIREAARTLPRPDPQEQQKILAEFLRNGDAASTAEAPSAPAERLAAAGDDEVVLQHADHPPKPRRPFHFLETVDAASLVERVRHEHPQTIAIVAAHAPRTLAAELLWRLPESLRTEVLIRVIDWQGTDPQLLEELQTALEMSLKEATGPASAAAGLAAAREILAAVSAPERSELLDDLQRRDMKKAEVLRFSLQDAQFPAAAETVALSFAAFREQAANAAGQEQAPLECNDSSSLSFATGPTQETDPVVLKPFGKESGDESPHSKNASPRSVVPFPEELAAEEGPRIDFADFPRFDDRTLSRILSAADPQVALLALTGAPPALVERLLRRFSKREAANLRRRMASQGPFRLRDVERAQEELAAVAARLAAERKIRLPLRRAA